MKGCPRPHAGPTAPRRPHGPTPAPRPHAGPTAPRRPHGPPSAPRPHAGPAAPRRPHGPTPAPRPHAGPTAPRRPHGPTPAPRPHARPTPPRPPHGPRTRGRATRPARFPTDNDPSTALIGPKILQNRRSQSLTACRRWRYHLARNTTAPHERGRKWRTLPTTRSASGC